MSIDTLIKEESGNLNNSLRCLSQLEKAIDRVIRAHYFNQDQWPQTIVLLNGTISNIRIWIDNLKSFDSLIEFYGLLAKLITELGLLISELWTICQPKAGKKRIKQSQKDHQRNSTFKSINSPLDHMIEHVEQSRSANGIIGVALEKAIKTQFDKNIICDFRRKMKHLLSNRGAKTYVFLCADKEEYMILIEDKKQFQSQVVDKLFNDACASGHKSSCVGKKAYVLCGYRKNARKTIMSGGQETFPIRMVQCKQCKQRFSVLPSFLPREKHYGIDIIANVFQNILLYAHSLQATLQNLTMLGKGGVKSK